MLQSPNVAFDWAARDRLVASFRHRLCQQIGLIPFWHQAEWQLATEGYKLLQVPGTGPSTFRVRVREADAIPDEPIYSRDLINGIPTVVVGRAYVPRAYGPAHVSADLAAYKTGKSYWLAAWAAGFAIVPGAQVQFVGLEYGTSEPEFSYLLDFLISDRGLGMKYDKLHNDKRGGRMILRLRRPHHATFEVKSWNQKESLKGAKITAYVYTEAYMLPGLEVYTTIAQNLRELHGFAVVGTTPDRPWVGVFHKYGHGADPDWHCTCGVHGRENPFTFDQRALDRDDPAKNGVMTRERFAISWEGKLGSFVGSVYDYQIGTRLFSPQSHPTIWNWDALAGRVAPVVAPDAQS